MPESPILKVLSETFPKTNRNDWKKTAISELNGNEPFNELQWSDKSGLKFFPYYDKEDITKVALSGKFTITPDQAGFLGNRRWFNLPKVTVSDFAAANSIALNHLQNGADGIYFHFSDKINGSVDDLLANIETKYCYLSFGGVKSSFVDTLKDYCERKGITADEISGNILWTSPVVHKKFFGGRNFKMHCISVPESSAVNEIHHALVSSVEIFEQARENGTLNEVASTLGYSVEVGTNFLSDIAKLKALRILWYQLVSSYGVTMRLDDLHIHAISSAWVNDSFQPHGNMLKATSASMAAIIGGCDALTIAPENENNVTMNRIARNVSNILREESHFDKVADPLAGSYAIEVMIDEMAKAAWTMFQNTMNKS